MTDKKKPMFIVDDGDGPQIMPTAIHVNDTLNGWFEMVDDGDIDPGDTFTIKLTMMSDAEFDALPEV